MKYTFISLAILFASLLASNAQAQVVPAQVPPTDTTYWRTGGSIGINFSQVKLSNWAGGGESSISIAGVTNLEAIYQKGSSLWENKLNVAFGLIRQGDEEEDEFRKTDDIFQFRTQYNQKFSEHFFITTLADFQTQMAGGYEYYEENGESRRREISSFLSPGFLLTSLGATYKIPERFSLTLSPFTGKFTFVKDQRLSDAGAFGVEPGEHLRKELGASLMSSFQAELFTNVSFATSLSLFGNYDTLSHIDVNWEGGLVLKVNRFINSTVSAQLLYDHDVLQKTQFKNVINVGLLYKWPENKEKKKG